MCVRHNGEKHMLLTKSDLLPGPIEKTRLLLAHICSGGLGPSALIMHAPTVRSFPLDISNHYWSVSLPNSSVTSYSHLISCIESTILAMTGHFFNIVTAETYQCRISNSRHLALYYHALLSQ
jgi:hypothetical protein